MFFFCTIVHGSPQGWNASLPSICTFTWGATNFLVRMLQEDSVDAGYILLHPWGLCILLGPQGSTYKMAVQACSQCPPRVRKNFSQFPLALSLEKYVNVFISTQIRHALRTDFRICTPRWDTVSWFCNHYWPCHYWASSDDFMVMDGSQSAGDSWGSLWLPFPMEPFKLSANIWGVSAISSLDSLCIILSCSSIDLFAWNTSFMYLSALIFMITTTACCIPSLETMHQPLCTWIGEFFTSCLLGGHNI